MNHKRLFLVFSQINFASFDFFSYLTETANPIILTNRTIFEFRSDYLFSFALSTIQEKQISTLCELIDHINT